MPYMVSHPFPHLKPKRHKVKSRLKLHWQKNLECEIHWQTSDFLALPTRPTLPPFSARPAGSNSSAGLKQQQDGQALQWVSEEMKGDRELYTAAGTRN